MDPITRVLLLCGVVAAAFISVILKGNGTNKGSNRHKDDMEEIERANKRLNSIGVAGLLTREELEDEANYNAKYADNKYIQNNSKLIEKELCVLTPSFSAGNFMDLAKELFGKLVKEKNTAALGNIVDENVDISQLPESIKNYAVCFMHNYIVENGYEHVKAMMSINDGGEDERYFVTFTRKSPAISVSKGEPISIHCPNCGGNITFVAKHMLTECPYCNNLVTFAEYDWILSKVEHITGETVISNRAVIKKDSVY